MATYQPTASFISQASTALLFHGGLVLTVPLLHFMKEYSSHYKSLHR